MAAYNKFEAFVERRAPTSGYITIIVEEAIGA